MKNNDNVYILVHQTEKTFAKFFESKELAKEWLDNMNSALSYDYEPKNPTPPKLNDE